MIYNTRYYLEKAIHRKAVVFDPSANDNPIIQSAIYESALIRNSHQLAIDSVCAEIESLNSDAGEGVIPPGLSLINHKINNAWVDVIIQMVFRDNMFSMFSMAFNEEIKNVIYYSSNEQKEFAVYRFPDGKSIFHVAANMFLVLQLGEMRNISRQQKILKFNHFLTYINNCYDEVCKACDDSVDVDDISAITSLDGETLMDYLISCAETYASY